MNSTQTCEWSPIPVLTGPDVDQDQWANITLNRHLNLTIQNKKNYYTTLHPKAELLNVNVNIIKQNTKTRDHSKSVYLSQNKSGLDPESGSDYFQNLMRTFFVQSQIYAKIFIILPALVPEIWPRLWKADLSRNVEESFRKFLDLDPKHKQMTTEIYSSFLSPW